MHIIWILQDCDGHANAIEGDSEGKNSEDASVDQEQSIKVYRYGYVYWITLWIIILKKKRSVNQDTQ